MDLSSKDEILSRFPLFSGLEAEHLEVLASIAIPKRILKRTVLFRKGDPARGFYLLVEGKIKLSKVSPSGKEQILHFVHPGQSFAEAALYMDQVYPATAEAIEESHLLYLPRGALAKALSADPNLSLNLVGHLAGYLQILTRKVEELSLLDATARIAHHLLSGMDPVTGIVRLSAAKGQVAASLGMALETFSRALTRFKDEGILKEASPGVLQVLHREALKKYSS
jgi:CRP-like cAMP-binding protein